MPTNYYEQTTPYTIFQGSQFKRYRIDDNDKDEDLMIFDDEVDNNQDDDDTGRAKYDNFDDDFGTPGEFLEAFNPNVQVLNLVLEYS